MLIFKKSYEDIVKPLTKIEEELKDYAMVKLEESETLFKSVEEITTKAANAEEEAAQANVTALKIRQLLS